MSSMNEEGGEDRFSDTGRVQEKSSSILKASALFVITCALVALIGWSSSATEPAESLRDGLGDRLGEGWHAAPPEVFSSEDEERFKEALKPAVEREWDGIQCVQTEASAACENGVPDFWLFVYGPYDGMDCKSLAILKNIAEWQIEAAEPWRAHCRERPDAPHLPYPTFPAHDSVEQKVVCLSGAEEEILFDNWEIAELTGFDLSRCSLQERVVPAVDMPSDAERPLCLGHSADTAVFDTLRFTLWDYFWLRGDIQSMWQYGDEDDWRELSESCSQSRRLDPYTNTCRGRTMREATMSVIFSIGEIFGENSHFHWHAEQDTMRGLKFDPPFPDGTLKACPSSKPANAPNGLSGWARPYYKTGAQHYSPYMRAHTLKGYYCQLSDRNESPKAWLRINAAFSGTVILPWHGWKTNPGRGACNYDRFGDKIAVYGKGSVVCNMVLKLPDPRKAVREGSAKRTVCD